MAPRREPRRKLKTDTVVNPPHGQELIPLVGKLMLNFGTVELQSHLWIDHLSHDDLLVDMALEAPFGRRVDLIHQLIDREQLPPSLKERAHEAWKAASALSEIRNAVAHNPLVWGWRGPEQGEPDFVGIPVIRKLKANKNGQVPLLDRDALSRVVDDVVRVARIIVSLFADVSPHKLAAGAPPASPGGSAA
jgi:hypothetical protein